MNLQNTVCDRQALERLLTDRTDDAEAAALEAHLADCSACRESMDRLAADDGLWQDARHLLVEDDEPTAASNTRPGALAGLRAYLTPTDDPRLAGRLGGYGVVGLIGCGGFGVVLKAFDAALNRYVAIKVLSPQLAQSGVARQRFAREARAAAAVIHDHVVAIHSVAEAGGLPYFVMPFVSGPSLEKRLRQTGALAVVEVLRIGMQIAAGLAAAHAQGLVHRDIKPANILLEDGAERVTITDFGLARAADDASLTTSGVIAGTPPYMSPEQAAGQTVDLRSDLFSLGSVMYATCTGRPPFRAESTLAVLRRVEECQPPPIREINADVPAWLAGIIARLHAKDPTERFQSAAELASLLEGCLAHVQRPTGYPLPPPAAALGRPKRGRRRWTVAAGIALAAATASIIQWLPDRQPAGRATTLEPPRPADVIIQDDEIEPRIRNSWDKVELIRKTVATATESNYDRFATEAGEIRRRLDELGRQADGKSEY